MGLPPSAVAGDDPAFVGQLAQLTAAGSNPDIGDGVSWRNRALARPRVVPVLRHPQRMDGSLLTATQVAELLGVPTSWVYEQSRAGRIPTVTLGRYRRYRREAIEEWLKELEAAGSKNGARAA